MSRLIFLWFLPFLIGWMVLMLHYASFRDVGPSMTSMSSFVDMLI